ncbi:unnamed protein product [Lathyrus oleraceus]
MLDEPLQRRGWTVTLLLLSVSRFQYRNRSWLIMHFINPVFLHINGLSVTVGLCFGWASCIVAFSGLFKGAVKVDHTAIEVAL